MGLASPKANCNNSYTVGNKATMPKNRPLILSSSISNKCHGAWDNLYISRNFCSPLKPCPKKGKSYPAEAYVIVPYVLLATCWLVNKDSNRQICLVKRISKPRFQSRNWSHNLLKVFGLSTPDFFRALYQ